MPSFTATVNSKRDVALSRLRNHLKDCEFCYAMRPLDFPKSDAEDVREPSKMLCIRGKALLATWELAKSEKA